MTLKLKNLLKKLIELRGVHMISIEKVTSLDDIKSGLEYIRQEFVIHLLYDAI